MSNPSIFPASLVECTDRMTDAAASGFIKAFDEKVENLRRNQQLRSRDGQSHYDDYTLSTEGPEVDLTIKIERSKQTSKSTAEENDLFKKYHSTAKSWATGWKDSDPEYSKEICDNLDAALKEFTEQSVKICAQQKELRKGFRAERDAIRERKGKDDDTVDNRSDMDC